MTGEETRPALAAYFREVADRIGLRDWTIELNYEEETPVSSAHASVECVYGRRLCVVHFGPSFWTQSREEQRNTVVHELVHCHLDPMDAVVRDMETQLGSFVHSVLQDNHHRSVELAADAIATAVAWAFPLPPEGLARP